MIHHFFIIFMVFDKERVIPVVQTFSCPNCSFYLSLEIILSLFDPTIKFESNCFWTNKNIQNSECKYNSTFGIASAPLHYTVFINYYMTYILKPLNLNPNSSFGICSKLFLHWLQKFYMCSNYYNVQTCKFESNSSFGICSKLFF